MSYTVTQPVYVNTAEKLPRIATIIQAVAKAYQVTPFELKGRSRTRRIAYARHVAIYLSRTLTEQSVTRIGQAFGRDHSTACHSIAKITATMAIDEKAKQDILGIARAIRAAGVATVSANEAQQRGTRRI